MDKDTRACADALNEALLTSGLTQNAFALALGTSASRLSTYRSGTVAPSAPFFLRALRIAKALREMERFGWMSAPRTARAVAGALDQADEMWAYKMILQGRDHLRSALQQDEELAGAWEAAPGPTGSVRWDVFLAATASHEFEAAGLASPTWTALPRLEDSWVLDSPRLSADQIVDQTPPWLRVRGIYVSQRDLTTV